MTASGHYHCSVDGVGRAKGRSIIAAAAYRAGERLRDEASGRVQDYQLRRGVLDSFIIVPEHAPAWAADRERLWNAAERADARPNARLATELEVGLPHELSDAERRAFLENFVRDVVQRHGVTADVAIHAPGEGRDHRNYHAHILLTHRQLGANGFGEIANARTVIRKRQGQQVEEKIAGIAATPADIRALRQDWERAINRAYEKAGLDIRVDHRSHKERGIEAEPTKHLGPTAAEMERRGKGSARGDDNRETAERNASRRLVKALEAEARQLDGAIVLLEAARGDAEQRKAAIGRYDALRPPEARQGYDLAAGTDAPAQAISAPGVPEKGREPPSAPLGKTAGEIRADASEGRQELRHTVAGAEHAVKKTFETLEAPVEQGIRTTGRIAGALAKAAENILGGLFSFFGASEPKLTPAQAERAERAAGERQATAAAVAVQQEAEAARDEQIFEQDRQQQQANQDIYSRFGGVLTRPDEQDEDHEQERDRGGREREW